jgi:hypothetical protein
MINKQTTLDLNGPILSFIQQPQSVTVDNDSTVTFTGIATATFPVSDPTNPSTNTGILAYRWHAEGFGPLNNGPFRGATLTGTGTTTLNVSNAKSPDTHLTNFFLTVDYIPSAYSQPPGSAVTVGTARSTGNAVNDILGSNNASLTVRPFITIINQPQDATVVSNSEANFSVDAKLSDERFGTLSYQWQLNDQNLSDQVLIRGSRQPNLTITTSSPLIEPSLSAPVCISVIDESNGVKRSTIRNDWLSFSSNHPNREFWLLQPGRTESDLKVPEEYYANPKANGPVQVARDGGNTSLRSDWFVICNLNSYAPGTVISLAIDTTGSLGGIKTVRASYDLFKQKCAEAGLQLVESTFRSERWARPHNINFPSKKSSATCISVIDESNGVSATTIRNDWLSFRSNYPIRTFWLLQPGRTKTDLKIPAEYEADSRANYSQVARDGGNTSLRSDWFVICNLQALKPGTVISLAIDTSGSMGLSIVKASYDLFKQKCDKAGLVIVESKFGSERWASPHNVALPEPESTTVGISTVRVFVSNPSAQTVISNNADLNVLSTFSRRVINFEYIPTRPQSSFEWIAEIVSANLFSNEYILTPQTNIGLISFYAPEIDIDVEMDLYARSGRDQGSFVGGRGGFSRVRFTLRKNTEYVIGGFNSNGSIVMYRQSTVLLVCGNGGDAGTGGNGGAGGGVNDAGENGGGRSSGSGGILIQPGTLDQNAIFGSSYTGSETPKANVPLGGKIIGCPPGNYWRTQGFSPCQLIGNVQFRLDNGRLITNTETISRGYKTGISYRQVSGLGDSGANGGLGATGGAGGLGGGGGGGGSGYHDGSIEIIQSSLGGNDTGDARIIMRLVDSTMDL